MKHVGLAGASLALALFISPSAPPAAGGCVPLSETFEGGVLRPDQWLFTSANEFRQRRQEVVRRALGGAIEHQLRLGGDTHGTDEATVKYVGIVHPRPLDLRAAREVDVEVQVDWNAQGGSTGVSAGVYLVPVLTWETPEREPDWLKFEYEGVGPHADPRAVLALRRQGHVKVIAAEGASTSRPRRRRTGPQAVRMALTGRGLRVFENGVLWHESADLELPFRSAYLYLQMSSRGNEGIGEVFFDDILVRTACDPDGRSR